MAYKLYLDDYRKPSDSARYMFSRLGSRKAIYLEEGWRVARNYQEFVRMITEEMPSFVSFDHDLADEHYTDGDRGWGREEYEEPSGYQCAKYLIDHCRENNLALPECAVHSMNPVGAERILQVLNKYYEQTILQADNGCSG